jgi:hypothetical protein
MRPKTGLPAHGRKPAKMTEKQRALDLRGGKAIV